MLLLYSSQTAPLAVGEDPLPSDTEQVEVRVNWMMKLKTASAIVVCFRDQSDALYIQVKDLELKVLEKEDKLKNLQQQLDDKNTQIRTLQRIKENSKKSTIKITYVSLQPWVEEQKLLGKNLGVVHYYNWMQQLDITNSHQQYFKEKADQLTKRIGLLEKRYLKIEGYISAVRKECDDKDKIIMALKSVPPKKSKEQRDDDLLESATQGNIEIVLKKSWPQADNFLQQGDWGAVLSKCEELKQFLDLHPQFKQEYDKRLVKLVTDATIMRVASFQFNTQYISEGPTSLLELTEILKEIDAAIEMIPSEPYFYYMKVQVLFMLEKRDPIGYSGLGYPLAKEQLSAGDNIFAHFLYADSCVHYAQYLGDIEKEELSNFLEHQIKTLDLQCSYRLFFLYSFVLLHHSTIKDRIKSAIAEYISTLAKEIQDDLKDDKLRILYSRFTRNELFKKKSNIWIPAEKYYRYVGQHAFDFGKNACETHQYKRFIFLSDEHDLAINSLKGFESLHTKEEWDGLARHIPDGGVLTRVLKALSNVDPSDDDAKNIATQKFEKELQRLQGAGATRVKISIT